METEGPIDLIDFAVGSPDLPTSPLSSTLTEVSDHLLDSELPLLEQRLQTTKDFPISNASNETVDIEDILITIDDDSDDVTVHNSNVYNIEQRRNSEILLGSKDETDTCADETEVLSVLQELDQVLEESLERANLESSEEGDEFKEEDVDEEMVRQYLMELDNYLRMLEEVSDAEILNSGDDPNGVMLEDGQEYYIVLPNVSI